MASLDGMKYLELARLKTEGEPVYVDPADELLVHATERYTFGFVDWRCVFGTFERDLVAHTGDLGKPHLWIPKLELSPPVLVAGAAAAAIVKNPEVTRRFWRGWFK